MHKPKARLLNFDGPYDNWLRQCRRETLKQYENSKFNIDEDIRWFSKMSLFWNIDTCSGYGGNLTSIRLSSQGKLLDVIKIKTVKDDLIII
ncbi:hypothetical protein HMPREF1982_03320 [Clostridiales bacterium oral taxon 876 str. F0540]|nr:hypothetical protein HMPREF1982_03320 [Clostridiales bacterium oral taxon 876 str. F0540]